MKIDGFIRNDLVLKELGRRIAQKRIRQNRSQKVFAREAGISRSGLQRLEQGDLGVRLSTFVSALRALGCIQSMDSIIPNDALTPLEVVKLTTLAKKGCKKRASRRKSSAAVSVMQWGDGTPMKRMQHI